MPAKVCERCEAAAKEAEQLIDRAIETPSTQQIVGVVASNIRSACLSARHAEHDAAGRKLVEEARRQAEQLAREGVNGTPNLLHDIADHFAPRGESDAE